MLRFWQLRGRAIPRGWLFCALLLPCLILDGSEFTNSAGMRMVEVEPGEFFMGEGAVPPGDWDAQPVRRVTITEPVFISAYPVSVDQFKEFRARYRPEGGDGDTPARGISWYEAQAFCEWLSGREGEPYRLPTEAEWEWAARLVQRMEAGEGDSVAAPLDRVSLEWCADWYGPYPDQDRIDPAGPPFGTLKVVRGLKPGSEAVDVADRMALPPEGFGNMGDRVTFRVVLDRRAGRHLNPEAGAAPAFAQAGLKWKTDWEFSQLAQVRPHLRVRFPFPRPLFQDSAAKGAVSFADFGFSRGMAGHLNSVSLAALPNGDLVAVYSAGLGEAPAQSHLVLSRLRRGEDTWDFPELLLDIPDIPDQTPLIWADGEQLWLFWHAGAPDRFLYRVSRDLGGTWSGLREGIIKSPEQAAITGLRDRPFRDANDHLFLPVFGENAETWLLKSEDGGLSWADTGGRVGGRGAAVNDLGEKGVFALGGDEADDNAYMNLHISGDSGSNWDTRLTPFPRTTPGHWAAAFVLQDGAYFVAMDWNQLDTPSGAPESGATRPVVAYSDDEGATWEIRDLPAGLVSQMGRPGVGQTPDGLIHLITLSHGQVVHLELNEAWLRDPPAAAGGDRLTRNLASDIQWVEEYEEVWENGTPRLKYSAGIGNDGRFLLHGRQIAYYQKGNKQWEVTYNLGRKMGRESFWGRDGTLVWARNHQPDGSMTWVTYRPDRSRKTVSEWNDVGLHGSVTVYGPEGEVMRTAEYQQGIPIPPDGDSGTAAPATEAD